MRLATKLHELDTSTWHQPAHKAQCNFASCISLALAQCLHVAKQTPGGVLPIKSLASMSGMPAAEAADAPSIAAPNQTDTGYCSSAWARAWHAHIGPMFDALPSNNPGGLFPIRSHASMSGKTAAEAAGTPMMFSKNPQNSRPIGSTGALEKEQLAHCCTV